MIKFIFISSVSSFFFGLFGVDWESVDQKIDREFPGISFVSTTELNQQIQTQQTVPVIIDVRESNEFAVSHLPGALNVQTGDAIASQLPEKETPIVVYCSVGYRSAEVAARLQELGYANVRNLRHSIFEWAEKGLPLQNQGGTTRKVHPFNRAWGSLVDSELHAYDPE